MNPAPRDHAAEAAEAAVLAPTLRACPHCGPLPAMPEFVLGDVSRRWQVFCGPCGSSSGSCRSPAEAAAHWNSRHVGGAEIGTSSAARTELAVWLSNTLVHLDYSAAAPIYGFTSPERQVRAYDIAEMILTHVNHRLRSGDNAE